MGCNLFIMSKYRSPNYKPQKLTREFVVQNQRDALITAEIELAGLVSFDMIAKQYLRKLEEDWFYDRNLDSINAPDESFTSEECLKFAEALEDVAARALKHAKEIRDAKYLGFNDMPEEIQQKYWDALDEEVYQATGRRKKRDQ